MKLIDVLEVALTEVIVVDPYGEIARGWYDDLFEMVVDDKALRDREVFSIVPEGEALKVYVF